MVNNKNQPCLIFAGVLYCPKVRASLEYLTLLPYPEPQPHLLLFLSLVSQSERPLPSAIALYSLSVFLLGRGGLSHTLKLGQPVPVPTPPCPRMGRLSGAQPGSCCPAVASCGFLLYSSREALAQARADGARAGTAGALPIWEGSFSLLSGSESKAAC